MFPAILLWGVGILVGSTVLHIADERNWDWAYGIDSDERIIFTFLWPVVVTVLVLAIPYWAGQRIGRWIGRTL
jgi:hypothetical protein